MPYKNPDDQRACARRHYEANRQKVIDRAKAHAAASRAVLAAYLHELKSAPCTDCRKCWPYYVMQFDHVGDNKVFTIALARSKGYSLNRVKAEVAKCEVVCANCHAVRTHERSSGSRI